MAGIRDLTVNLLVEMLKIYTPSLQEAPLSRLLAEKMSRELGFKDVYIGAANNVVGEVGSGSPTVLLCGHIDTVPGQQPVKVVGDLIYGRGACDAKSALAAMIIAASSLSGRGGVGKIMVACVGDEEGNGKGVRELLKSGVEADYAIFGEPSGVDSITIGYKGRLGFTVTCGAPSVHASASWMHPNAVEKAFEVWSAVKRYTEERRVDDPYRSITASLTGIHGGSSPNTTPDRCRLTIDMRIPPHLSASKVAEEVRELVGRFQADPDFPKVDIRIDDVTEPFEADRASPLVRAMVRAVLEVRGRRPMLLKKTGTGDMNLLGSRLHIPVVTYGPGDPHLSHTKMEYVEVSELLSAVDVYRAAVLNLARLHRG